MNRTVEAAGDVDDPRQRLLAATTTAMATKGYVAATVADVVREARVSRRTFYEHFANKDECFLAAYEEHVDQMLAVQAVPIDGPGGWAQRLTAGVDALVAMLLADPAESRLFHVEIFAVGPLGHERRMETHRKWARVLAREIRQARNLDMALRGATRQPGADTLLGLVGGVDQLIRAAVTDDPNWTPGRLRTATLDLIVTAGFAATPEYRKLIADRRRGERRRAARPAATERRGADRRTEVARAGARQGAD